MLCMQDRDYTEKNKRIGNEEKHKRKQESKHKSGKVSVHTVSGAASQHQGSAGKQVIQQARKKKQECKKVNLISRTEKLFMPTSFKVKPSRATSPYTVYRKMG